MATSAASLRHRQQSAHAVISGQLFAVRLRSSPSARLNRLFDIFILTHHSIFAEYSTLFIYLILYE